MQERNRTTMMTSHSDTAAPPLNREEWKRLCERGQRLGYRWKKTQTGDYVMMRNDGSEVVTLGPLNPNDVDWFNEISGIK